MIIKGELCEEIECGLVGTLGKRGPETATADGLLLVRVKLLEECVSCGMCEVVCCGLGQNGPG